MITSNKDIEKKIIFDKPVELYIYPKMTFESIKTFKKFISDIKKTFSYHNSFFWAFDSSRCLLTINESIEIVDADIFNQFVALAVWLFQRDYYLSGTFNYRIEELVGKISLLNNTPIINHQLVFEPFKIGSPNYCITHSVNDVINNKENTFIRSESNKNIIHSEPIKNIDYTTNWFPIVKFDWFDRIRAPYLALGIITVGTVIIIAIHKIVC